MYTSNIKEVKVIINLTLKDIIQMELNTPIRLTKHDIKNMNSATDIIIKIIK